jgi:HK97 family phage major capsid protein
VIAARCDVRETDKPNNIHLPAIDETSRADGSRSGGAQAFWLAEGFTATSTWPQSRAIDLSAKKLLALCPATNELCDDVPLLDGHLRRVFAAEMSFKLDLAILRGTGAGLPRGIVNASGTITAPKAIGQASGTIIAENIANMWSRLPAPCRSRAVWLANEDCESQLELIGTASTNGMYFPAGAGGSEFAFVKGRSVIVCEQPPTLGTPGDIVLADLSQYVLIDGGLKASQMTRYDRRTTARA